MGESYDGRAAVPSISREGVTQKSCRVTATQSIIKVTEQSVCFGRGGVTAFTERRVTGVVECRWPDTQISVRHINIFLYHSSDRGCRMTD